MPQQAGYREGTGSQFAACLFTMVLVGQAMRIESVDGLLKRVDGAANLRQMGIDQVREESRRSTWPFPLSKLLAQIKNGVNVSLSRGDNPLSVYPDP